MRKYTFFDKRDCTCNKEEMLAFMQETTKPFKYTHGLIYRGPATLREPISKEEAINIVKKEMLVDVDEMEDYIHVNTYSSNDMW